MTCDFIGVYQAVTTKFTSNDEVDMEKKEKQFKL